MTQLDACTTDMQTPHDTLIVWNGWLKADPAWVIDHGDLCMCFNVVDEIRSARRAL